MVEGPDKKLPVEYLHGSMQWYIIQSRHVQKIQENFAIFFFLKISIFSAAVKIAEN